MKITIQSGINIWRIAGRTVPVDGVGIFQGRLLSEVRMTKQLARVGNTPITLPINIRNNDAYISSSIDLWGADVTVVSDSGYTWRGKITAYDSDGGGIMYITATEKSAPELLVKFPDEVARLVTLDEKFHVSAINVTLPMVVGGTVEKPILVKGILIDKTAGIYLLCGGDNHQIPNVYRGTELLTAGFAAYTGTAGQANYPGFAYVQLTDESLRKNDDGTYVEISADVVGLKLGTHTIEECRNGARFLLWLLKTAREGVGGWGLGIAESDIDLDAFNTAIARVDAAGLKMDGIFYFRQIAQSWIDQICHAIRGSYSIGDNGKRRLFVNAPAASRKTYTKKNIKLLRYGKGAYTGQVYNRGKIEFGFNPLVGQFTQTAQYEDATSIGAIDEQEFTGQSYLVREMATGKALVDYTCKKSLIGATKVYFETKELLDDCHEGDIITVDYPEKGISGTWQINILDIGDRKHRIEAEKFSDTIFVSGDPGTAIDWVTDAPIIPSITPGAASGLTLSSGIRPGADGTNIVVLSGTFTQPSGAYLAASIEYGEGALPILDWKSLGMVQGNSFEIVPVKPAQLYAVRIRMISSTGKSAYVTATITTQGDDVPPGQPSISATSYLKNISAIIALGTVPSDLAGFQIFRHTANNSAAATLITSVSSKDGRAEYHEVYAGAYGDTLYYWAKAFDTWGNVGAFSSAAGPLTISAIEGADIVNGALSRSTLFVAGVVDAAAIAFGAVTAAKTSLAAIDATSGALTTNAVTALNIATGAVEEAKIAANAITTGKISNAALSMPAGPVAAWTAKGATAASIAEAGGVRDISGNGMHGQAFGNTTLVDSAKGKAFSFDGTGDYVKVPHSALLSPADAISVCAWIKGTGLNKGIAYKGSFSSALGSYEMYVNTSGGFSARLNGGAAAAVGASIINDDVWHLVAMTYDRQSLKTYVDGVLEMASPYTSAITANTYDVYFGAYYSASYSFSGAIVPPKIYNRALTAAEIKTLYMMTEDAAFGTITADLLTTGELITDSAQIKSAIINDAHVANLSAAKLTTGILAADRIAAGSVTAAKLLIGSPGAALNDAPSFEDASAWGIHSASPLQIVAIADGVSGTKALRGYSDGTANHYRSERLIPIDFTKTYRVSVLVRKSGTPTEAFKIGLYEYDSNAAFLSTALYFASAVQVADISTGFTRHTFTVLPAAFNAATRFVRVSTILGYLQTGGYYEVQDLRLEEVIPGTLIQDGAVTTDKIAANSVTASKMLIGSTGAALNTDPQTVDISAWRASTGLTGSELTATKLSVATTTTGYSGDKVLRAVYGSYRVYSMLFSVDPAKVYRMSVMHRSVGLVGGTFYLRAVEVSAAGVYAEKLLGVESQAVSSSWTRFVASYTPTAGTVLAAIHILPTWTSTAGYVDMQDIRCEEMLPSTLIQDGAITTEKIYALSVTTAKLAAAAVTAEKMLIGKAGSALNDDPNFEDASAWRNAAGYGGTSIVAVSGGVVGTKALQTVDSWVLYLTTKLIPVDPGKQYRITGYVKGVTTASTVYFCRSYYETGAESDTDSFAPNGYAATTSWTRYALIFSVPAGKKFLRIGIHQNTGSKACQYQDVRIEEVLPATLIQDGAIVTDKLAANCVVASKVSAGAIETAALAAGCVTTDKLVVGGGGQALNSDTQTTDITAWTSTLLTTDPWAIGGIDGLSVVALADGYSGNKALRLTYGSRRIYSRPFAVDPAKTYRLSFMAKASVVSGSAYVSFGAYNAAGTFSQGNVAGPLTVTTAWTRYTGYYTPAAGIVRACFQVIPFYASTSGYSDVQDIRFEEMLPSTLIKDGSITTAKLTTDAIKSTNYSTTVGSFFDLAAGDVKMGGSSAPRFSFTNSTNTGVFAGFTFNATDLTAGATTTAIGISTDTAKRAFWAGSATPSSAPFNVTHAGALTASSGVVGGFTLESTRLWGKSIVDANNYLYNYLSGASGVDSQKIVSGVTDCYATFCAKTGASSPLAPVYVMFNTTDRIAFFSNGQIISQSAYFNANCSALSFTDRTAMPESLEDALEIVNTMQAKDGKVDYAKLTEKAKHKIVHKKDDGTEEVEEGRDLTLTVSALVMVNQKQQSEIAELQKQLAEIMEKLNK